MDQSPNVPSDVGVNTSLRGSLLLPSPHFRFRKWDKYCFPDYKATGRPVVILIGPTNVGKGTLANWLFNFGITQNFLPDGEPYPEGWKLPFEQRLLEDPTKPHTQDPYLVEMPDHGIDLLDITGINDEKDLRNSAVLFSFLSVLPVSGAIFCQKWDQADDKVYALNMEFYCSLLGALFSVKRVMLALTNVPNYDYEQARDPAHNNWQKVLQTRLDAFNKFIPESQATNRLDMALPFSCKFADKHNRKFWSNPHKQKDSLMYRSTISRTWVLSFFRVPAVGHKITLFPLPPLANTHRIDKVSALHAERERLLKTLETMGKSEALRIRLIQKADTQLQALEEKINKLVSSLDNASSQQTTMTQSAHGDSVLQLIYLFKESPSVCIEVPPTMSGQSWVHHSDSWSCTISLVNTSSDGTKKTFQVRPDLFTFGQKDLVEGGSNLPRNWFGRIWGTYDGKIANKEKISSLTLELSKAWNEYKATLDEASKERKECADQVQEQLEQERQDQELSTQIQFLANTHFNISDIGPVIHMIDPDNEIFKEIKQVDPKFPQWICDRIVLRVVPNVSGFPHVKATEHKRDYDVTSLIDVLCHNAYTKAGITASFPGLLEAFLKCKLKDFDQCDICFQAVMSGNSKLLDATTLVKVRKALSDWSDLYPQFFADSSL